MRAVWSLLPLATVYSRGEGEVPQVSLTTDGQIRGFSSLRLPFRRWESGGAWDLCLRCVYSRVDLPPGVGMVVESALGRNKLLQPSLHRDGVLRGGVDGLVAVSACWSGSGQVGLGLRVSAASVLTVAAAAVNKDAAD